MENIDDQELERLQVDLNLRLDNPEGETEEERDESRKRTIDEIADLIAEVKCRKRLKNWIRIFERKQKEARLNNLASVFNFFVLFL